jgi:hypothetical protein
VLKLPEIEKRLTEPGMEVEPFLLVPPPCAQKRLGGELRLASLAAR